VKFKDSLMFAMLEGAYSEWNDNDVYHFILKTPYVFIILTLGIVTALIVDFFIAMSASR